MDSMKTLVLYAMLGSIARKAKVLSDIDDHAQDVLNPNRSQPKPNRAEIKKDARHNFKQTMHLLSKGTR